jgi:hypothetical protein
MKKQKIIKVIFALVSFLMTPSLVLGAPSVSGVSGIVADSQNISISGSSFGAHSLNVESLQSNIEAGVVGQALSKSNWIKDWGWANPLYANDFAHSGSKSLKCTLSSSSDYNCAFAYDMSNVLAGQKFYATWWVKYNGDTNGQWKIFRASGIETIVDGPQEIAFFDWLSSAPHFAINPGTAEDTTIWTDDSAWPAGDNTWYRVELELTASSTNQSNGAVNISRYTNAGSFYSSSNPNLKTHVSAGDSWSYAIWQNYIGNGIDNATIWLDDLYVQYNTVARVELCANSTWSSRGRCEIQVPSAWTTSLITASVNKGSFANGSNAYVYVVDSAGTVNASGYPVTIGSGGGDTTSPSSPSGLLVL